MRLNRPLRIARDTIVAQSARIKQLESQLAAAEQRAHGGSQERVADLEKELKRLARSLDQARAGVVDDAQTAALRHACRTLERARRELEQRLNDVQAANDGISRAGVTAAGLPAGGAR